MSGLQDQRSGEESSGGPKRRTFASVLSALIGIAWALGSILFFIAALITGPTAARVFGAPLLFLSAMLALPWSVAWLRRKAPLLRPTFVPPLAAIVAAITGISVAAYSVPEEERLAMAAEREAEQAQREQERREERVEQEAEDQNREEARRQLVATQINEMWEEVLRVSRPCDQAAETASDALGRSDLVASYQAAREARRICASAGLDVRGIDAPRDLERPQREAFEDALENCGDAYAGKSVMFDRMLDVIDGDMRPSRVAAVQEAGQISQAQVLQCVLRLNVLASEQGVELGGEAASE